MRSIPFAFSIEYGDILSPDDAYDLYWAGKLTNQSDFECPGDNCKASATLANMYTEALELRQRPHYRCKPHSPDCEYIASLNLKKKDTSHSKETEQEKTDIFKSNRPEVKEKGTAVAKKSLFSRTRNIGDKYKPYVAKPKFYAIRPIVDRYFTHREDENEEQSRILIDDESYTYKSLFKGIYNQSIESVEDEQHIYWGKAFINRSKSSYRIVFLEKFMVDGKSKRPAVFISDYHLDNYPFKKRLLKYLNKDSVDKKIPFLCFVLASPVLTDDKAWVNFKIDSLDFIDFKETSYLKKLKRNNKSY